MLEQKFEATDSNWQSMQVVVRSSRLESVYSNSPFRTSEWVLLVFSHVVQLSYSWYLESIYHLDDLIHYYSLLFTIIHYYLIPIISIYPLKLLIIEIHSFQGVDIEYPASAPRHAAASGSRPARGHPDFQWPWPSCAVGLGTTNHFQTINESGFDLWSRWFFSLSANVLPLNLGVSLQTFQL